MTDHTDLIARLKTATAFVGYSASRSTTEDGVAAIEEAITALEQAARDAERVRELEAENHQFRHWIEGQYSSQLCCSGYECGCMGATQGQEIIHHIEQESRQALKDG